MTPPMDFFQPPGRLDTRYPVNLPVSVKLAHKEMHAQSENISLGGILLSSASPIPKDSVVELAVGVAPPARPGTLLSARGKVLRAQPKATGGFAVAIKLDHSFKFELIQEEHATTTDEDRPYCEPVSEDERTNGNTNTDGTKLTAKQSEDWEYYKRWYSSNRWEGDESRRLAWHDLCRKYSELQNRGVPES